MPLPSPKTHSPATHSASRSRASRSRSSRRSRALSARSRRSSTARTRSKGLPVMKKLPGAQKWGDITLKRGRTDNKALWDWIKSVQDGNMTGRPEERFRRAHTTTRTARRRASTSSTPGPRRSSIGSLQRGRQRHPDRGSHDRSRRADACMSRAAPSALDVAKRDSGETLRTEFSFELPRGYVDDGGSVHRKGIMRLATARRRDPSSARPAGAGQRELPHGAPALAGRHGARGPAGGTPRHHRRAVRLRSGVSARSLPPREPGGAHAGGGRLSRVQARIRGRRDR